MRYQPANYELSEAYLNILLLALQYAVIKTTPKRQDAEQKHDIYLVYNFLVHLLSAHLHYISWTNASTPQIKGVVHTMFALIQ